MLNLQERFQLLRERMSKTETQKNKLFCSNSFHSCLTSSRRIQDYINLLQHRYEDLVLKEEDIRKELRRQGGHRGKVQSSVLVWLEDVERVGNHLNVVCSFDSAIMVEKQFAKLLTEVDILQESASSLVVFRYRDNNYRVSGDWTAEILIGKSAQEVSSQIWELLTDPMSFGMIALYGEGGVGKTTIMKNIKNQLAYTQTFDKILWVTMSENVTLESLEDDIAAQLSIKLPPNKDRANIAALICHNLKNVKKCLLILDDVRKSSQMELLKLIIQPTQEGCCQVVITSRSQSICLFTGATKLINLEPLSENEAWSLFVSRSGDHVLDPKIQGTGKEIVKLCQGLPLAIITVGCSMRRDKDVTSWERAFNLLRSKISKIDSRYVIHILDLLRFCFMRLESDQVRRCFLYCGFFPEEYKIQSEELIGYWTAEEFIQEGDIVKVFNRGAEILRELKDANMLQVFMEDDKEWVKMHDLFRNLATIMIGEELVFMVKAGLGLTEISLGWESIFLKKMSIVKNGIETFKNSISCCFHCSTLLLRDNPLPSLCSSFFDYMPELQVLDMSYSGITKLPSVSRLTKLRALFLQYCTSLKEMSSLEKLEKLQILNLRGTLIKKLPQGIQALVNLRSLDLSETIRLEYIQEGVISSFSSLEELHLQGSRLCKMESPMVAYCFREIRLLKQLAILTFSGIGFEDQIDTILHLQCCHKLKRFSSNVYGSTQDYADDV